MTSAKGKTGSAPRKAPSAQPAPREALEQKWLLDWARLNAAKYPELRLFYHIPNEGLRSTRQGFELKRQGMQPGFPDNCLPVPRGPYGALYIELKRRKGGKVSAEQRWWIDELNRAGNLAVVCRGWEEAAQEITNYLKLTEKQRR